LLTIQACDTVENAKQCSQIEALCKASKAEAADFVACLLRKKKREHKIKEWQPGGLKGMIIPAPDFDEPLEDFKEHM